MDAKNYVEFTRLWYANHLPFPLTLVLPNLTHRAVKWKLSTSVSRVTDCEMNENVVSLQANLHVKYVIYAQWNLDSKHLV